jgi:Skp family chaperone for outer membrane proteins
MNKLALGTAIAALSVALPGTAALAQRNQGNAPVILVVDTGRVLNECTACKAAGAALQQQAQALQQRQQQVQQQLRTEGQPLQTAMNALNGRPADAALQARVTAFQNRQQQLAQELQGRNATLESTQAHVTQQLGDRLLTIVESIRAARRASIVVSKQSTLANDNAVDVTTEALTQLNQQLPSVSVTPMPQAAAPAPQPQGR